MARKDERGVVIPAPLQFNNPATASLPRYDDEHRGPAVRDAYELSHCWIDLAEHSEAWPAPENLPPRMVELAQAIPDDQRADWLRRQANLQEVDRLISYAMRSGDLPVWVAPIGEPERLVAPGAMLEVDQATIHSGCYRPPNDRGWLYGRPLFVKWDDWVRFVASVQSSKGQDVVASSVGDGGGLSRAVGHTAERHFPVTSTAGAESECQKWLADEFAADPEKQRTKADFQSAALARFSGRLSARGFMRAWDAVAPQAGRSKPGRKS